MEEDDLPCTWDARKGETAKRSAASRAGDSRAAEQIPAFERVKRFPFVTGTSWVPFRSARAYFESQKPVVASRLLTCFPPVGRLACEL